MVTTLKQSLWKQFGASIDMLGNAIQAWPDNDWNANNRFFYIAYHSLIFLDYYLTIPPKDFISVLPFTLVDADKIPADAVDDIVPDRMYSKTELLEYLRLCRQKCRKFIAGLSDEKFNVRWIAREGTMNLELSGADALQFSVLDILLYNMKHVQHHTAQLNLILRQALNTAPDYVSMAPDDL
jgi:hypothetical protein